MLPTGKINKYEHFFVDLPEICIFKECYGHTLEGDLSQFRDVRNVFKRSLDEISKEAVDTVLELIAQNSLYKGAEWKKQLTEFKNYQKEYGKLTDEQKELWIWEKSIAAGAVIGKIRNHSIGTLLVNIAEGMDLDLAVRKYEQIVAPVNYKRPKAIFTKKMLGKITSYEEQLRALQKENMQLNLNINACIDKGDDEGAKVYLKKQQDAEDKIAVLKDTLKELRSNATAQKEMLDSALQAVNDLKSEKDKAILTLETAQVTKSLQVTPGASDKEEDKMLEVVREGIKKQKEAADGTKAAFDASADVQQKRLDKKMKDEAIDKKLQELKVRKGK